MQMKKQWMITCMAILLLSHTSCVKEETVYETSRVESRNQIKGQRVQDLVHQARHGNAEAYKSLAYCYRDGNGVEKSFMNAMFMYALYCRKTNHPLISIIELFEEGTSYRLLAEIMNSTDLDEETQKKIDLLQQVSPADAKILIPTMDFFANGNHNNILKILQEAETEGSELAGVIQALYYEETKDTTMLHQCLVRIAEKHPFSYLIKARMYEDKYYNEKDFSYIQKAMEYYYKADAHGMLTRMHTYRLLDIYEYYSQEGLLEYNEPEIERLNKIIELGNGKKNQ